MPACRSLAPCRPFSRRPHRALCFAGGAPSPRAFGASAAIASPRATLRGSPRCRLILIVRCRSVRTYVMPRAKKRSRNGTTNGETPGPVPPTVQMRPRCGRPLLVASRQATAQSRRTCRSSASLRTWLTTRWTSRRLTQPSSFSLAMLKLHLLRRLKTASVPNALKQWGRVSRSGVGADVQRKQTATREEWWSCVR